MKKIICLFLLYTLYFLLPAFTGCEPKKETQGKIKIGVSVATQQETVYTFIKQAMTDNAQKENAEILWVQADNKKEKQYKQVDDLLSKKIDVLILHPVETETAKDIVDKAHASGIPVIALDRLPAGAKVECYVTADSFEVGRIQAQFLADKLNGKGNVVIIKGHNGNNVAGEITKGNLSVLCKYSEIKVLAIKSHEFWSRQRAKETVKDALRKHNGDIRGILCNNSSMAMGALEALRENGLIGKILVVGTDADLDACEAIARGELSADVDKMPYELGRVAFETAAAIARGQLFNADKIINNHGEKVKVKLTPIKLITKENVGIMKYRWPNLAD